MFTTTQRYIHSWQELFQWNHRNPNLQTLVSSAELSDCDDIVSCIPQATTTTDRSLRHRLGAAAKEAIRTMASTSVTTASAWETSASTVAAGFCDARVLCPQDKGTSRVCDKVQGYVTSCKQEKAVAIRSVFPACCLRGLDMFRALSSCDLVSRSLKEAVMV